MLCNMDKNVFRSFALRAYESQAKGSFQVLFMQSVLDGEYGPITLRISCELETQSPEFHAIFIETSGASQADLHNFRISEIWYFVSCILPLFNPLTVFHDEVPFPQASQSQNS